RALQCRRVAAARDARRVLHDVPLPGGAEQDSEEGRRRVGGDDHRGEGRRHGSTDARERRPRLPPRRAFGRARANARSCGPRTRATARREERRMSDGEMRELLDFGVNAAREAGEITLSYFRRKFETRLKGKDNFVTQADIEAEEF